MALLALLAVAVMVFAYVLVSRLNTASRFVGIDREHNAKVLNQAKQALVGYAAMSAAQAGENNPGRLPCPEGNAFVGSSDEGISAPRVGAPVCASIGRLPWRTLGLDKLVDASGEPLWYVVGPSWRLTTSTSSLVINSDTPPGDIAADGQQVVALIIAPGAAIDASASTGCMPRTQARNAPSPAMDAGDYLECFDAATLQFVTSAPATSLNDQVVRITTAEVLPAIEAAIAHRFEREIAPALRSAYSSSDPANPNPIWPASNPVLPFAAPFADPTASDLKGSSTASQGLMPLNRGFSACSCSPAPCTCAPMPCLAGPSSCDPAFVAWASPPAPTISGPNVHSPTCTASASQISCTFYYQAPLLGPSPYSVQFSLQGTAQNVGMALRQVETRVTMPGVHPDAPGTPRAATGTMNVDGSATISLNAHANTSGGGGQLGLLGNLLCGITGLLGLTMGCDQATVTVPISLFVDHPVLDSSNASLGWFVRNRWPQVSYYAVAPEILPSGSGSCVAPPGTPACLSVDYRADSGRQRGIWLLAGSVLPGKTRWPALPDDWFEGPNAFVDTTFAVRSPPRRINREFNDRIAVIDANP